MPRSFKIAICSISAAALLAVSFYSQAHIPPHLAQFLPDARELWVDYLNRADRRFRLPFMLTTDGEKLEFLDLKERPFKRAIDTGGPPFFIFVPDKSVSPACNKIEFFH